MRLDFISFQSYLTLRENKKKNFFWRLKVINDFPEIEELQKLGYDYWTAVEHCNNYIADWAENFLEEEQILDLCYFLPDTKISEFKKAFSKVTIEDLESYLSDCGTLERFLTKTFDEKIEVIKNNLQKIKLDTFLERYRKFVKLCYSYNNKLAWVLFYKIKARLADNKDNLISLEDYQFLSKLRDLVYDCNSELYLKRLNSEVYQKDINKINIR